jgi:hypothetical protein
MYRVDAESKRISKLTSKTFTELGLLERFDIQEWIAGSPEILGEDLLIIAKEHELPSRIRIDLLAVDRKANLVIIELKRDESGSAVEWQAIKYASYCSNFTAEDIFAFCAQHLQCDTDEARSRIEEFIDGESSDLNQDQRIILVAREFHSDVASAVLWLRDYGVDITCIRLRPYVDLDNDLFINPDIIIPLPEARDYIERRENKRREEKQPAEIASSFSMEKGEFDDATLEQHLRETLARSSPLTPRLVYFLEILLSEDRGFKREDIISELLAKGIGSSKRQTGTYLSNVSQLLTRKSNPHLRQIIAFTSSYGGAGAQKDDYRILPEYRALVQRLVDEWNARDTSRTDFPVPHAVEEGQE